MAKCMNELKSIEEIPDPVRNRLTHKELNLLRIILEKLGTVEWDTDLWEYRVMSSWSLRNACGSSSWMGKGESAAMALSNFMHNCSRYIRKDGYVVFERFRSGTLGTFDRCMIHPDSAIYIDLEEVNHVY